MSDFFYYHNMLVMNEMQMPASCPKIFLDFLSPKR